jgi:hypothetical protein
MNWMAMGIRAFWRQSKVDLHDGGPGIREFWHKAEKVQLPKMVQCNNLECLKWVEVEPTTEMNDTWICGKCHEPVELVDKAAELKLPKRGKPGGNYLTKL